MTLKHLSFLFTFIFGTLSISFAQTWFPLWQKDYQGIGDNSDRFNQIIHDGSGNFIATGYSIKPGNYRDFLTVKINSAGDTLWWRTKNGKGNGNDEATSVAVDALGNIYVTGYSDGGKTEDDIYLIKYNSSGVMLWDTTWDSPASLDDVPVDMAIDANGSIFICGNAEPDTVTGSMDYITLKFNPNGGLAWSVQYSRTGVVSGKDETAALTLDSNGDCFVTGRSENAAGDDDMLTFKYSGTDGSLLLSPIIYNSGNGDDRGVDVVVDNAGDFYFTGRSTDGSHHLVRTLKYSSAGGILWSKFYNGTANQNDRPVKMILDGSGNLYICGETDVDNSTLIDYDYLVLKYPTSTGNIVWARTVGSNAENDTPTDIAIDAAGDIIITGKADMNTNLLITNNDFMTVKYNPGGTLLWTQFHSGTRAGGSDIPSSVIVDAAGNYWVAGGSENNGTQKDAVVIKYSAAGNVLGLFDYNGEGDFSESGRSIVIDANNNAYVGGYTFREGQNRDILLVRLLPNGDTACTYTHNGSQSDDDELSAIAMDASGNVYATGYTKNVGQKSDMFTMKFSALTCDTLWTRTYNHTSNQSDKGESIVVDAAGNVYVTGRTDTNANDTIENNDIITIKYNTNGDSIWSQQFNGIGNLKDEPSRILLDNAGNVVVCGRTEKLNDDDFVLLKYAASNGADVWGGPSLYNGPFSNDDRALDMTIDAANNIFVCGYSQTGSGSAPDDAAVIKFNSAGSASDFFFFDGVGLGTDQALAITHDNSNQIYVTFRTDVDPNPLVANYDYLTMKFDNNLLSLWPNPPTYNGPINSDDIPVALTTNAARNVVVTGYSKNDTLNVRTNIDWVTIQYDSLGIQQQISIIDGALGGDDEPNAMALKGSSLWVTGFTIGNGNNQKDLTTVKYDLNIDVNSISREDNITTIYPNPFSNKAILKVDAILKSSINIQIYDVLGQIVESIETDDNSIILNREQFNPGMFFYQIIESNKLISSGKFIVE